MPAQPGDTIYNLIWKLVEAAGGTPRPGDSERDLLAKYLTAIGGVPIPGDTFYDLLVKVLRVKGGTPQPGDNEWLLLVKWLQIEGECRKCGDSVYDLWRKILLTEAVVCSTRTIDLFSDLPGQLIVNWSINPGESGDLVIQAQSEDAPDVWVTQQTATVDVLLGAHTFNSLPGSIYRVRMWLAAQGENCVQISSTIFVSG